MCCVQVIALLHYATESVRKSFRTPVRSLFSEGLCRILAYHLICDVNRLPRFCMERSFTGQCYQTNHNLFLFTYFYFCKLGQTNVKKKVLIFLNKIKQLSIEENQRCTQNPGKYLILRSSVLQKQLPAVSNDSNARVRDHYYYHC